MITKRAIQNVVVLGANGTMGAGAGALFAISGFTTTLVARTVERAQAGRKKAIKMSKGKLGDDAPIRCTTYDDHEALANADLVLEAVAEDPEIKRPLFANVDQFRKPDSIIATVSSGLSITDLCADRSPSFRAHFLGIHLFNPPTIIVGCELIPHAGTDPGVIAVVRDFLQRDLRRQVIETRDTPAFAGNRLGFKVLNEVAQLAEEHGVVFMDQLVGLHTGRALAPLATIDLVGWDVHAAIVDNLATSTNDFAHASFELPAYMRDLIARGHLGRKTRDKGGFYKRVGDDELVLRPQTGDYVPRAEVGVPVPAFVERMQAAVAKGDHVAAFDVMCTATGHEADLLRRIMLGYVSYGLGLVGQVVERPRDVDRIMSYGFSWAPPGMVVDAIGAERTIALLDELKLPVPACVRDAAEHHRPVFHEDINTARLFPVAA